MLSLHHVSLELPRRGEPLGLLQDISWWAPAGHLMAVVGPSGCGKSTMLKTIAGINHETGGEVCWKGKPLSSEGQLQPSELGYVPQFSIAYDHLSVEESIEAATRLRVVGSYDERWDRIEEVLGLTGLESISDRPVKVLSGGQKRRLGLAMELVSDPALLLCDEVTSGLDPRSEEEIVGLMHELARQRQRLVVTVTHSLSHLALYDSVLVLFAGHVSYHGAPNSMTHYFGVEHPEDIYPALAHREPAEWSRSWAKHRSAYYRKMLDREDRTRFEALDHRFAHDNRQPDASPEAIEPHLNTPSDQAPHIAPTIPLTREEPDHLDRPADQAPRPQSDPSPDAPDSSADEAGRDQVDNVPRLPGALTQFWLVFSRRWKIFFRDRVTLLLHLAILIGFPALVAAFAADSPEAIRQLSNEMGTDLRREFVERATFQNDLAKLGGWISGLIMFQVVLLTLMAANNSAREIAGERDIFEKEKLGGLSPAAYLAGRIAFLVALVTIQSLWMAGFVEFFWPFPGGHFGAHLCMLLLVNGALTSICLGISALLDNPDQANLLSIYLVGFQLPLSGAILALPGWLEPITRPLISAYWSWSGSISSLADNEKSAVTSVAPGGPDAIASFHVAVLVLLVHLLVGLLMAFIGARRSRWRH